MAGAAQEKNHISSSDHHQQKRIRSSRLQKRAPASIQVNPASSFSSDWKVAIPLLSPLVLSPSSPPSNKDQTILDHIPSSTIIQGSSRQDVEKPTFKLWQHPAAPFHYEPAPFLQSFVVPRCR
ncbi:hypothetical protein FRX31_033245 [Thalictrum thalictroides]|uniref:Uncharacterized protein n=1 Tax=Thalictrum thalictroides TaxID=46969 RepID=A0A7J6UX40_THATH|nr:hypothetical protein FRX31_033245 [Thalictrum thalictroides]